MKSGTHSPFRERLHTRAYTPKQGAFLPRPQCGFALPAKFLLFTRAFIYIHFPVHCEPPLSAERKIRRNCRRNAVPNRFSSRFSTSRTNGPRSLSQTKASTLGSLRKIAHKGTHGETGVFRIGALSLPSDRFAWFGNPAWPGLKTANFAAFGPWPGALPKHAESLRNSDALMRVAAPRRRGPAGLRDLFATW